MKAPRNFIPLAVGSFVLLAGSILGVSHLEKMKESEVENLSRETADKIEQLRLRANTRALNKISSELRTHEKALEQLEELKKNNSFRDRPFTYHSC